MNCELISRALTQYGIAEVPGTTKDNPEILKYFDATKYDWVQHDETAWCSAFINWVARMCGYEASGELNARSWLEMGEKTMEPDLGTVVIFWRDDPESWKGHVSLFVRQDEKVVWVLGGNQSNSVCIKPYLRARVLGYRNLKRVK